MSLTPRNQNRYYEFLECLIRKASKHGVLHWQLKGLNSKVCTLHPRGFIWGVYTTHKIWNEEYPLDPRGLNWLKYSKPMRFIKYTKSKMKLYSLWRTYKSELKNKKNNPYFHCP